MKIAVLSDVHGNLPALEAVLEDMERWRPDQVIVNGDLINRGPNSLACLCLLDERVPAARAVKGNHEGFVLRWAGREPDPCDPGRDLSRFARWTAAQLGEALARVQDWPDHLDHLDYLDPDGGSVHVTHGSRLGNREGILPETEGEELRAKLGDPRDLFVASHTHKPLVRRVDGTLVVNTGSVGAPFDRDPRAAYGRLTFDGRAWQAEIVRVAFDRDRAERDFASSGFLDGGGPLARVMLAEHRHCRGHMGPWMRRYQEAVLAGVVSVGAAVDEYLAGI